MVITTQDVKDAERLTQYYICKERGHVASEFRTSSNPRLNICTYCGVYYRIETTHTVIENDNMKPKKWPKDTKTS